MKHEIKIEQTEEGATLIVPPDCQAKTCVTMPTIEADQHWNAVVGKGSRLTLCERDIRASEIIVESGAQLDLVSTQMTQHPTRHAISKRIILRDKAIVRIFTGLFDSVDVTISGELEGNDCVFENHVVYFGSDKQDIRMTLVAHHRGEHTMSRTLIRGVVVESSHADMVGTIHIAESGHGTDAHLGHEGLLLSRRARIDSLPGLEIGTNDVRATHSSAVHYIRPEQLFYMQTRGLETIEARQLMVKGFLEEMLATVREPQVLEGVYAAIEEKQRLL